MQPIGKDHKEYWRDTFHRRAATPGESFKRNGFLLRSGTDCLRRTVLDLVGDVQGQSILDVGCGDGSVSAVLAANNNVTGLDLVQDMLMHAAEKGLTPVEGSMEAPPFAPQSFDIVIAVESISLTAAPLKTVATLSRLVRPGGRLIVSCVNGASVPRIIAERILDIAGRIYPNAITLNGVRDTLVDNGMKPLRMRAVFALPGYARPLTPASSNSGVLRLCNNVIIEGLAT